MSKITDIFKQQTGYNVEQFILDFQKFMNSDYYSIEAYYEGKGSDLSGFDSLKTLNTELSTIIPLFDFIDSSSATLEMWQLLDVVSDIQTTLSVINNLAKWKQSSFVGGQQNSTMSNRLLKSNESFESVALFNNFNDPQNDWRDIAVSNEIREEDYTVSGILPSGGGTKYQLKVNNKLTQNPTVVIDIMVGDNAKGKDIDTSFTFSDNDLNTVSGNLALDQSASIILNTAQGDIPEYPSLGIPDVLIGSNVSSIQYPLIVRGLSTMFDTDDRWEDFELTAIERKSDALFIDFNFSSIFSDYNTKISRTL